MTYRSADAAIVRSGNSGELCLPPQIIDSFGHSTVRCTVVELNFGERVRMMRNNGMRIVDQDERGEMAKGSITRQSLSGMKIDLVRALVSRSAICLLVST